HKTDSRLRTFINMYGTVLLKRPTRENVVIHLFDNTRIQYHVIDQYQECTSKRDTWFNNKASIVVYDDHARDAANIKLGQFAFLTNIDLTHHGNEMIKLSLRGRQDHLRSIRLLNSDSRLGQILEERLRAQPSILVLDET